MPLMLSTLDKVIEQTGIHPKVICDNGNINERLLYRYMKMSKEARENREPFFHLPDKGIDQSLISTTGVPIQWYRAYDAPKQSRMYISYRLSAEQLIYFLRETDFELHNTMATLPHHKLKTILEFFKSISSNQSSNEKTINENVSAMQKAEENVQEISLVAGALWHLESEEFKNYADLITEEIFDDGSRVQQFHDSDDGIGFYGCFNQIVYFYILLYK